MRSKCCAAMATVLLVWVLAVPLLYSDESKTNKQTVAGTELRWKVIDDKSMLITNGFPYRTDVEMNYRNIRIEKFDHGLFMTTEDSVQPIGAGGFIFVGQGGAFINRVGPSWMTGYQDFR